MTDPETRTIDRMSVRIFESNEMLGQAAANDFAKLISGILSEQETASVIFACANSQLTFLNALRGKKGIAWNKIIIFHMDEYLGMSDQHPASFARFIREKLIDFINPAGFYPLRGASTDIQSELKRYTDLLRKYPPDVCVLGVGENGHLAFNDPPADFKTKETIHVVDLDSTCREQQVNEGHFPSLDKVPEASTFIDSTCPTGRKTCVRYRSRETESRRYRDGAKRTRRTNMSCIDTTYATSRHAIS